MTSFNSYAVFDTISSVSTITSIQVLPEGTKVSLKNNLNLAPGNYVLILNDIPKSVIRDDLSFNDIVGLSILNLSIEHEKVQHDDSEFMAFQKLNSEIESVSFNIKALDAQERALLKEKKENQESALGKDKKESFATYFQKQGTSIREQRRNAYKQLVSLRERGGNYITSIQSIKPNFKESNQDIFLTFVLIDSLHDELNWNYLIRTKVKGKQKNQWQTSKTEEALPTVLPAYVSIKGQVIESQHLAPIIFASIQFYQKGKLVSSTATDYEGKFSLPLATNETYEMVISFNGYKKKRFKKIHLNQAVVPEQTIRMEVKHKISALEVIAYALPIIDMVSFIVR